MRKIKSELIQGVRELMRTILRCELMRTPIIFFLFLIINVTLAQEVFKFFEFAPRSTDYILFNNQTLIQPFIPFNDYLSIIGLWLDNSTITPITLKIIDPNNEILISKEINIPVINGGWYGEEYQIPLGENFKIESGKEYKLVLETATSSLRIFTKNILEILQGSENYLYFPESLKALSLNNETTSYTLKLALYEGREFMPPVITNLKVNILSPNLVNITFNSNEPIMYRLDLVNLSTNASSTYKIDYFESCPPGIRSCTINLETLPDSHYQFSLTANDFWNNTSTLNGEFITPKETTATSTSTISTSSNQTLYKSQQKAINQQGNQTPTTSISSQNKNITPSSQSFQFQPSSQATFNLGIPQETKPRPYSTSILPEPQKFLSTSTFLQISTLTATKTLSESQFSITKFLIKQKFKIFLIIFVIALIIGGFIGYKKFFQK